MPYKKRKKNIRQRGSKTHGWGSMKKHRGAGNRGGRGMAGSGKRAKQKKTKILKLYGNEYFGKKGFKRPQKVIKKIKTINITELKKFKKTDLDLTKLGYNKLLGKGSIKQKYNIKVQACSKKAKERIEKLGGKVTLEK